MRFRYQGSISDILILTFDKQSDEQKGSAEKLASVLLLESWVTCGDSLQKGNKMDDNLMSVSSILVNFSIFYQSQQQMKFKNGNRRVRSSIASQFDANIYSRLKNITIPEKNPQKCNYKAEHSRSCTLKCVMLSTKRAGFISLKGNSKRKLSFQCHFVSTCQRFQPSFGSSHATVMLAWCQNLV